MAEMHPNDLPSILRQIKSLASSDNYRVSQHAHQEMVEESVRLDDVLAGLSAGIILENYPEYRRGPCCLVYGIDPSGRPLHIVCTTMQPRLIIITVYEPKPPKWLTPTQRRLSS